MAKVLTFQGGTVPLEGSTPARIEPQNFGAAGQMIGRALEGGGQALSDFAERQAQIQGIHDQAAVKDAVNAVGSYFLDAGHDGTDPFFSKQGKAVLEARPAFEKGLDDTIKQQSAALKTPNQRRLFDQAMTPQRAQWGALIADHTQKAVKEYDADESSSRVLLSGELARSTYINDPAHGEAQISTGIDEINNLARLNGWGKDKTALEVLKFTSGTYKDIGTTLANSGRQGPDLARALVDKVGNSMTGDDRTSVLDHARVVQSMNETADRQAEAEMRRLANDAKHDARDRAESAIANLDSGLPMDAKTYASALDDAKQSEDEGLYRRLQNGQIKNSTLFAHQNDTPGQIQESINSLSAKISRAGAKADPNDIIQRDALQQLYGHVSQQVKTNPLAWGASVLGQTPPSLNVNDPRSIAARSDFVRSVSRRAGEQVSPLQPDEVSPLAQTWRAGDANAKASLVMRLAQFRDLAPAAAQQVAPNDNGLLHLIGLASHSNRGVAVSRVMQAMAGYDAMKTEGTTVGKKASADDFNTFVGGALQFMPGAKDGVFTVAKALLAEDASQHGWSDQNPPDDKAWYRAVNSALGAYTKNGVQLGGLAGFNGAQTVLPENMGLDEFEGRIARANGPQMRQASNGEPVTGNGTPLGSGDLKKLHFVPVDDGIYRLESGGAFVHTKNGQPFEIDVRKLPNPEAQPSRNWREQAAAAGYIDR